MRDPCCWPRHRTPGWVLPLLLSACTGTIAADGDAPAPTARPGAGPQANDGARAPQAGVGAGAAAPAPGDTTGPGVATGTPAKSPEEAVQAANASNERVFQCQSNAAQLPPKRLRRLTGPQLGKTIAALLGGRSADRNLQPPFESVSVPFRDTSAQDPFSTRSSSYFVSLADMEKLFDLSDEVALKYVQKLTPADRGCLDDPARRGGCVGQHLATVHELMIGRPLPDAEKAALVANHADLAQLGPSVDAFTFVLRSILLRPSAYLLDEAGDASGALDSFAIARSLSYALSDGPPDKPLWAAAQSGLLTRPEELKKHILRLLASPAALGSVMRFFAEWYRYGEVRTATKDLTGVAQYDGDDLDADTDMFVANVLSKHHGQALFSKVLTNEEVFGTPVTRGLYGVTTGDKYAKRGPIVPPAPRPGVLAQPAWLIAYSDFAENQPMRRAKFVLERLLCASLPDVPIPDFPPPADNANATLRETFEAHTRNPACQFCHKSMDPIAFAFEEYDHLGRHRTMDHGKPVDSSGALLFTELADPRFKGLAEMVTKLAGTGRYKQCAIRNTWEYFIGRKPSPGDGCALQRAYERYEMSGGSLLEALAEMLGTDLLAKRRAP